VIMMPTIYVQELGTFYDVENFVDFLKRKGETPVNLVFVLSLSDNCRVSFYVEVITVNNNRESNKYTINAEKVSSRNLELKTVEKLFDILNFKFVNLFEVLKNCDCSDNALQYMKIIVNNDIVNSIEIKEISSVSEQVIYEVIVDTTNGKREVYSSMSVDSLRNFVCCLIKYVNKSRNYAPFRI